MGMIRGMIRGHDSGYDSRKCNMHVVINFVYAISGNTDMYSIHMTYGNRTQITIAVLHIHQTNKQGLVSLCV